MLKPYFRNDFCTVYHGDALAVMGEMGARADVCITDPPYGETSLDWDKRLNWLNVARPLLQQYGSVWFFTSVRHLLAVDMDGWRFAQDIVWEKHNGSNFHADRFRRVHELAVQIYPEDVSWSEIYKNPVTTPDATARTVHRKKRPTHTGHIEAGAYQSFDGGPRLARSVMQVRSCHGYAKHPTQKPLGIIQPLIEYSCPKGGIVLDPFAGSGSTALAAWTLGRNSILIERDEKFCRLIVDRIQQETMPLYATKTEASC